MRYEGMIGHEHETFIGMEGSNSTKTSLDQKGGDARSATFKREQGSATRT